MCLPQLFRQCAFQTTCSGVDPEEEFGGPNPPFQMHYDASFLINFQCLLSSSGIDTNYGLYSPVIYYKPSIAYRL